MNATNHNLQLNATNVSLLGRPFGQPDMVEIAGPKSRLRFTTANAHFGIGVTVFNVGENATVCTNPNNRNVNFPYCLAKHGVTLPHISCDAIFVFANAT